MSVELVFVHIPKCGGTSFVDVLRQVYGEDVVGSFWDMLPGNEGQLKDHTNSFYHAHPEFRERCRQAIAQTGYKVIHGHIPVWVLDGIFPSSVPIITWLREPLHQVLSWIFYCLKMNVRGLATTDPKELVYTYDYRNMQFFYTSGCLENFAFVGILEQHEMCLDRLACIMGWEQVEPKFLRVTEFYESRRQELLADEDFCKTVRALNCRDVALYLRAVKERIGGRISR